MNCPICSTELNFKTKPLLGAGKLSSGEQLCARCWLSLAKVDQHMHQNTKKYTAEQVKCRVASITDGAARIEAQLEAIGMDKLRRTARKLEVDELPRILSADEIIVAYASGFYNGGTGLLLATDRRLLFVEKGILSGLKTEDFGLDKVTSIQCDTGLMWAELKIFASGNVARIGKVDNASARRFSEAVRAKLNEPKATTVTTVQLPVDVADQLLKLARLKEQGILSQEEFDGEKKRLLGLPK
jgi:hypothetical protein